MSDVRGGSDVPGEPCSARSRGPRAWARWSVSACVLALLFTGWAAVPVRAEASRPPGCVGGPRPVTEGGRTDVLGFFGEVGVRCAVGERGWVAVGVRYAESRGNALPWWSAGYSWRVGRDLTLSLRAGGRERLGDWEGDRLPELSVRWALPPASPLRGQLEAGVGLFSVHGAAGGVVRAGARVDLFTRALPVGPGSAWLTAHAGHHAYGGGVSQTFLTWTANLRVPVAQAAALHVSYVHSDSSGWSPLRFDSAGSDRYWTAYLQGSGRTTGWRLGVTLDAAAGAGVREYQAGVGVGPNWFGLVYRAADGRLLAVVSVSGWPGR